MVAGKESVPGVFIFSGDPTESCAMPRCPDPRRSKDMLLSTSHVSGEGVECTRFGIFSRTDLVRVVVIRSSTAARISCVDRLECCLSRSEEVDLHDC